MANRVLPAGWSCAEVREVFTAENPWLDLKCLNKYQPKLQFLPHETVNFRDWEAAGPTVFERECNEARIRIGRFGKSARAGISSCRRRG